ncbi:hypothetical protein C2R22_20425 [Salinigranum rubrum]|uniref:Uncharacterized protein n=1 Tax=Salinigranum rubrum TaxID=755307 RepID=A0A2I8VRB0_9EURY|nr:hypothetical protein C2R22_20425 [Salinigranum rubrum]
MAFALLTAALAAVALWRYLVSRLLSAGVVPVPRSGGLAVDVLVTDGPFVVGVVAFAGAYAVGRDIDVGVTLPSDAKTVGLAVTLPFALVGLTKLVGTLDGVPYNSLTKTAYAADAPVWPVITVTGLSLLVGVPVVVAVCQVLVQGSLRPAVDGDAALVLTTLVTAFVMVDTTGRLSSVPDVGKVVSVVAFTALLALGRYGHDRVAVDRVRSLAYLPVALFVCVVSLAGVAQVESVTGGLFALTQLATFGVAAYASDRTGSLLPPALAYACFWLANTAVVYGFEAGLQHW